METPLLSSWLDFAIQQLAAESYLDKFLQGRLSLFSVLSNGNNNSEVGSEQDFRGKTRFVSLPDTSGALYVRGTAQEFANRYQIISHHSNDASGFSGTLLFDKSNSTYTLSFRSTEYRNQEFGGDFERDGVGLINSRGADAEILSFGFALGQLLAMEHYFEEVKAILPPGARINVTGYSLGGHLATVFTELHDAQVIATYTFNGAGRGNISGGGGVEWLEAERIRQMLTRLESILFNPSEVFPNPQSSPEIVALFENAKILTQADPDWNPFAAGSIENLYLDPRYLWARYVVDQEFSPRFESERISRTDGAFAKITQIVGHATSDDTEYTANSQNHAAANQIYIEDQPDFDGFGGFFDSRGDFGTSHSITLIVDSLALQDLFLSIDPTLTQKIIERIFSGSSAQHAQGAVFLNGQAEGNSLEYALDALYKVITGKSDRTPFDRSTGGFGDIENRTIFHQRMEEIRTVSASSMSPLKIEAVIGKSAIEMVAEATNPDPTSVRSKAFRYALRELNPFVVLNANYAPHGSLGELDIYVPATGMGKMSEQWIRDRASMLVALNAARVGNSINPSGQYTGATGTTIYASYDAPDGRVTIIPTGAYAVTRFVSFDSDEGNQIIGGNQDDRFYGAGGDDVIEGFGGRDWLEGGRDNDKLRGGSGDDELYGGEGSDFLYGNDDMDALDGGGDQDYMAGGKGSDRLFGREGADTLDGGEGSDRLSGGEGLDVYVFRSGDGVDTISDDDGLGQIVIDGRRLVSPIDGFRHIGNVWMSEGSSDPFSFYRDGSMTAGGILTITGLFHGQIRIENFRNGDLGILLSDVFADTQPSPPNIVVEVGSHIGLSSFGTDGVDHAVVRTDYGFFLGLGGNDVLGEVGNVTYYGEQLSGNGGNDWIIGSDVDNEGHGGDTLIGGGGADSIFGGADSDSLWGEGFASFSADDSFRVDGFQYWLEGYEEVGGKGIFYYEVVNQGIEDVELHFEGGLSAALHWILGTTESTDLSEYFNDYLDGGSGDDLIYGMAGSDELHGGDGNDILMGDVDDSLFGVRIEPGANLQLVDFLGQYGDDYLDGGAGNDKLSDLTAGSDVLIGGEGDDILENVERAPGHVGNINYYSGSLSGDEVFNNYLDGGSGNDRLRSVNNYAGSHDILHGGFGSDVIKAGGAGVQFDIFGGEGNDQISIGNGLFKIDGGSGDDVYRLFGGAVFLAPDSVVITDWDSSPDNRDRIELILFGEIGDLVMTRKGDDLLLGFNGQLDWMTLSAWFVGSEYKIEQLVIQSVFGEERVWDVTAIENHAIWSGTTGPDALTGGDGDETIHGGDGEDEVAAADGNDYLEGGAGNDQLDGGEGDDTYFFSPGDGIDRIKDGNGTDTLVFGDGVASDSLSISRTGDELRIDYGSDAIVIQWQSALGYRIENVTFSDGTVWDAETLEQMAESENNVPIVANAIVNQSAEEDAVFAFQVPSNTFYDEDTNDTLTFGAVLSNGLALPSWLSFDAGILQFSGTPENADVGTISVRVVATDGSGSSVSDEFDLAVVNINDAPVLLLALEDQIAVDEMPFSLTLPEDTFGDQDIADFLVYSVVLDSGLALPSWLFFDSITRKLSGTPSSLDIGSFNVKVTAADSAGSVVSDEFEITVNPYPGLSLVGDASNQQLVGKSGADILDGGKGADTLVGKRDDDAYFIDNAGDRVVEVPGEGNDLVFSSVSYALPENVENLTLTGSGSSSGTGNWLDNAMKGNSGANVLKGMAGNDFLGGGNGDDYLYGGDGNDALDGGADGDHLYGDAGSDCLQGNAGGDYLYGGFGQDILQGGGQDDYINDIDGGGLLDGGDGNDSLLGETGQQIFIGGRGDDLIVMGSKGNLIAFNAHDGKDIILPTTTQNTLSLGNGISYSDLRFVRSTWDLVFKIGVEDQITFKNWYSKKGKKNSIRLQMVIEGSPDYDPAGGNILLDNKVETFDFAALATAFDVAGQVNGWALTNALLSAHLSGSDTAAIGGDLAYQYGLNGSLTGIGLTAAQDVLKAPMFGTAGQALRSVQALQQGQIRLQ